MFRSAKRFVRKRSYIVFLLAFPAAFGQLESVVPLTKPWYHTWYQDKSRLTLEFCSLIAPAEPAAGWCVLLPRNTTSKGVRAGVDCFDEHFYFLASPSSTITPATRGGKAKLVLGLESACGGGAAAAGNQVVFARIRSFITNLRADTYAV